MGRQRSLSAYLSIGRVVDIQELVHRPVKPAHEENSQGQAVSHEHDGGVVCKSAGIDVPNHVVLENSHAIVDIRSRLSVGEAIKEPAKA